MPVELEQIILGCKINDVKAQEQLYTLMAPKLFGVCLKYSSDYLQAEDNLQDGFMLIFKKITQYNNKGSFEGWAKKVMINNALQKFRAVKHLEIVNQDVIDEDEIEIDDENISIEYLLEIIQQLPEKYRFVFNLYVMDHFSHQEIAEIMGISIGTSKSNLSRARAILKEKIEIRTGKITIAK